MLSTTKKVCDIQKELYDILPMTRCMRVRSNIHERRWDDAEERLSDQMMELYNEIQTIKAARKIIRGIRR